MNIETFLNYEILGNSGHDFLMAFGMLLGLSLLFYFFQKVILSRLKKITKKTKADVDDFLLCVIDNIKPPFYFIIAFYISAHDLKMSEFISRIVFGVFIIFVIIQGILVLQKTVDYLIRKKFSKAKEKDQDKEAMIKLLGQIIKGALWIVGGLLVLSNLGVNVNSLIAGLGIGGIAIALALQNILGDMFASFSIFIDKPFKVGDFIKAGADSGTVKKIGFKTSRIRTLTGDELVIPNKELVESRIRNFKKMKERRASFVVGVEYETELDKLEKIPQIIKDIFTKMKKTELKYVYFKTYGASSLDFEIIYNISTPSFDELIKIKQLLNIEIFKKFKEEGINFAYPTQKIFLDK